MSVKSTHIRHLFAAFLTNTVLDNQAGYFLINGTSLILAKFMLPLRHFLSRGVDTKAMTHHSSVYMWLVRGSPGE